VSVLRATMGQARASDKRMGGQSFERRDSPFALPVEFLTTNNSCSHEATTRVGHFFFLRTWAATCSGANS